MKKQMKKRKRKKLQPSGAPSLDSVFSSGHGTAFTSGMAGIVPGGESRKKKKKLPLPPPWPAGEETIIEKDGEFYEV
jgi:hypothetical protein